jgi:PAS domain S-box-containing protein
MKNNPCKKETTLRSTKKENIELERYKRQLEAERARREEIEKRLKESEERYRSILENIEDGYFEVDLKGNFTFFNDSICRMLGYSREELMGMNNRQYTDEENAKKLYQAFNKVYRNGEPAKAFDWEVIRKDGSRRTGEVSITLMKDEKGQPVGFRGIARDITERKKAEEILKAEREKFQILSDHAPFGLVMIDQEGRFQYINSKFKELFGYDIKDVPDGRTWFRRAYPDPEYRHQVIATWLEDFSDSKAGEKRPRVFKAKCKDGTEKIINFITVQLETGERLMACEDMTELKRAEEALRESEEQIRQLQKMEAVGRLAGGVAHDFNNLLTIIKGYSQLSLLELKEPNPLKSNLEEILKATERASNLTRQLLAFSRRQILEPRVLNLNLLIQDLNKMLHRILGEDVELIYHLAPDLGKVKIDPGQIEQVILNLAVNAREAMPSGGKLTIETSNVQLHETSLQSHHEIIPGPYIMLAVSDNGIGMSPEIREHIFEPFFTTKEKGTGLGLSTVYGIVKQSGGYIYVYSELGQGTTFKIYLPRIEEKEDSLLIKNEFSLPLQGNETVLVVEDEPALRELMVRILKDRGYQVFSASNGEETLKMFQEDLVRKVDLLVTDVVMPSMSGKQLADLLKKSFSGLKTLFISGYTDNAIVHHGVLIEGVDFLQKPFSPETLARKVREVLDRDRLIPILKEQKEI